jgi:hypothetical protein
VVYGPIWPVLWVTSTMLVGAATGCYPYPFLDVRQLGIGPASFAIAGAAVLIVLTELILWLLDLKLPWGLERSVSSTR